MGNATPASTPLSLAQEWRAKAKEMRRYSADEAAATLESCADDLEETWRIWETEPLTLEEAADESGYSYSAIQKQVASGQIPNVGEKGCPRVQRKDLPRKAGLAESSAMDEVDELFERELKRVS